MKQWVSVLALFGGMTATAIGQVVDGDLTDLAAVAQITRADSINDVCSTGKSGFDFRNVLVYYNVATDQLFIGLDVMDVPPGQGNSGPGVPGDADGDGNPDTVTPGNCIRPPFTDELGVGPSEEYSFFLDTDGNGQNRDAVDVHVRYQGNTLGILAGNTDLPIPGATGVIKLGTAGAGGINTGIPDADENTATTDVELRIDRWSQLDLEPCSFNLLVRSGSLVDGMVEDNSQTVPFDINRPPTITCPPNVTAECAGPGGVRVDYTVRATSTCDPNVNLTCVPPSGGTFPPGATQVCCTATDRGGRTAQCCFDVTVSDDTPPVITCPADITIDVKDVNVPVDFDATATDICDPNVIVQCNPPGGSTFPPGCTTVVCMATDDAGNRAQCSFEVCVRPCVSFDLTGAGALPEGTIVTDQYQPLGLHVSAISDTGHVGAIVMRQGPPGSTTDDLIPVTGPNYLQTIPGDGTSDSGVITFTFVDPELGGPRTSSYVRLTFLDIEESGGGHTRLEAFDENGQLVGAVIVPVGANGNQFTAQIGTSGGPLRIARAVATIGTRTDSGAVDELCYFPNRPDVSLAMIGPGKPMHAGESFDASICVRNNSGRALYVNSVAYAALRQGQPLHYISPSADRVMPRRFDRFERPYRFSFQVPTNRPHLVGRRVYIYSSVTELVTNRVLAQDQFSFYIVPTTP
ncbi:MAG: HYR domain-containing protein [Planctomycetes bacterium]|nr:HYR domain-containing protein [Planctomycetota bacterium]